MSQDISLIIVFLASFLLNMIPLACLPSQSSEEKIILLKILYEFCIFRMTYRMHSCEIDCKWNT